MHPVRDSFYRIGWLLPVWLPLAQVGGRALFNVLAGLYFFWGMIALAGSRVSVRRPVLIIYILLLVTMLASAYGAHDVERALRKTAEFLAHSMAFFLTLMVLQSGVNRAEALLNAFALSGTVLVGVLYLQLAWLLPLENFEPRLQLREDNLPFLIPMLLYATFGLFTRPLSRIPVMAAILVMVFSYTALSGGRAALAGLLVAVTGSLILALKRKWFEVLLVLIFAGSVTLAVGGQKILRQAALGSGPDDAGWIERIDRLSQYRITLWRNALENPPANVFLGAGMGNARFAGTMLRTGDGGQVRHLHNFVFDAGYEIGIIGITLLLALLFVLFRAGFRAYRRGPPAEQRLSGVFLSSGAAILVSALFSFSYASRQFSLYLFVILAALYFLYQQTGQHRPGT